MANRIKGITVEINGDTTKLSKALEGVNKNIRSNLIITIVETIIENLPMIIDAAIQIIIVNQQGYQPKIMMFVRLV